jgi:adenine-specific DNA methylase
MYTAYAFGYRRISPMFSIHSYRHITRPVEINPWLNGIGRGTFPNVLGKIAKAVGFAKAPTELNPNGGRQPAAALPRSGMTKVSRHPWQVLNGSASVAVSTNSSEDLEGIPDETIDLILTDPPYFDNLSYSELSDFYLAWHQSLGVSEPPFDNPKLPAPMAANLALTDRADSSIEEYRNRLRRILCECHRVLRTDGILVFTYHHKSPAAWGAIGDAIAHSGLKCTTVLPLRGEGQGGLHSYKGTIKWDAVFVCRKSGWGNLSKQDIAVVPRAAIKEAKQRAAAFAEELNKTPKIGFREPDRLNLERAMIVAAAVCAPVQPHLLPLPDALELNPTGGC